MTSELSQFDIADHQLTKTEAVGKPFEFTDIGEARVVHTLFGKAKVRIIHKRNPAYWWWSLSLLVVIGAGVAIWSTQRTQLPADARLTSTPPADGAMPPTAPIAVEPAKASAPTTPPIKSVAETAVPAAKPLLAAKPRPAPAAVSHAPASAVAITPPAVRPLPQSRPASQVVASSPAVLPKPKPVIPAPLQPVPASAVKASLPSPVSEAKPAAVVPLLATPVPAQP